MNRITVIGLWLGFVMLPPGSVSAGAPTYSDHRNSSLFQTAQQLYQSGHVVASRRILQSLVHRPGVKATPEMYCLLADTYLSDLEERESTSAGARDAEEGLHLALRMDPECGTAYKDLASFCNVRGDYKGAVFNGSRAIQVKKPNYYGLLHRSVAYSQLHDQEKALSDMNEFMKRVPPMPEHYLLKGDILKSLQKYDQAVATYRKACDLKVGYRNLLVSKIVECLSAEHKVDEAIQEVTTWLKIDPVNVHFLSLRGHLKKENKDYKGALEDLSRAISIEPSASFYKERSEVYTQLGQKDLAEKDLREAAF